MEIGRGEEGEGGMNGESSMGTYTPPYVKQNAIWLSELKPVLCNNLKARKGWRWEGGSRERGHMYTYGWVMLMYGRNQHNTVKQLPFN